MRLDHLLSKEMSREMVYTIRLLRISPKGGPSAVEAIGPDSLNIFGGDALKGDTRSHPEHDG